MNQQIRNGPHFKISTYVRRGLKSKHLQSWVKIHNLKIAKYLHIYCIVFRVHSLGILCPSQNWILEDWLFYLSLFDFSWNIFIELKLYVAKKYISRSRVGDQKLPFWPLIKFFFYSSRIMNIVTNTPVKVS